MNEYMNTILLLVILIVVFNRRDISAYIAWLRFKIHITVKQRQNRTKLH